MPRSVFVSKNAKTITIDGFKEDIVIRPLSAEEQHNSYIQPGRSNVGQTPTRRRSNSKAAEFGIVQIGDMKRPPNATKWRDILHSNVIVEAGKAIWEITL